MSWKGNATYQKQETKGGIYKVCLAGRMESGKTTIFQIISGNPINENPSNDFFEYQYDGLGKIVLNDTAGREHFTSMTIGTYYRGVHVIVFVYDATDQESLNYIGGELEELKNRSEFENVQMILIRNKCDEPPSRIAVTEGDEETFVANRSNLLGDRLKLRRKVSAKCDPEPIKKLFFEHLHDVIKGKGTTPDNEQFIKLREKRSASTKSTTNSSEKDDKCPCCIQ